MTEIIKIFENKGVIPQLYGERYERNMRQALSKDDFDKLALQLSSNFDIYICRRFIIISKPTNNSKSVENSRNKTKTKKKQFLTNVINMPTLLN
ncbi:hypothetical protein [Erysipelothrix urinaevulpis]|uniref:hypothetical protein n=1 Tax=Erysipelothrix urinaevulpis TaxID=2683717 RepID=UPI0019169FF9|nr:hypothetical protein [Erysipelothrix urinaevulpis]